MNLRPVQILKYIFLPVTISLYIVMGSLYIAAFYVLYGLCIAAFIYLPIKLGLYIFGESGWGGLLGILLIALAIFLCSWISSIKWVQEAVKTGGNKLGKFCSAIWSALSRLLPDSDSDRANSNRQLIESVLKEPQNRGRDKSSQEGRQKTPPPTRPVTQPTMANIKQKVARREIQPPPPVDRTQTSRQPSPQPRPAPLPGLRPTEPSRTPTIPPPTPPPPSPPDRAVLGRIPTEPDKTSAVRSAIPETTINFLHKQMQREIYECLTKPEVPGRSVSAEVGGIDLLVWENGASTMIEIKTGSDVVGVIREAIGQLLEYRYFRRGLVGANARFLIVAPLKITGGASNYLEFLEREYKLKVTYAQYVPGSYFFALQR
jgi:hypothetical protein